MFQSRLPILIGVANYVKYSCCCEVIDANLKISRFFAQNIVAIAGHVIIYSISVNDNVSPAETVSKSPIAIWTWNDLELIQCLLEINKKFSQQCVICLIMCRCVILQKSFCLQVSNCYKDTSNIYKFYLCKHIGTWYFPGPPQYSYIYSFADNITFHNNTAI